MWSASKFSADMLQETVGRKSGGIKKEAAGPHNDTSYKMPSFRFHIEPMLKFR